MRIAVLGLLIFIAATPPPPPFFTYADRAGNRIEALAIVPDSADEDRSAIACGRDGRCALLRGDGENGQWQLHMFESRPGLDAVADRPLAIPDSAGEEERLALWPHLVREADGALLVGILRTRSTGFSGGGASATRLTLRTRPPLRRRDLVWAADPACTYRRTYGFDAAAGRYVPDAALPDCPQYLDF